MAQVSMAQVKELRDRTQAGLNDCKGALAEADGDMEKAVEILMKKGIAKSAQRAGKIAAEGVVATRIAADGQSGVVVEVNIQTDFAARNPEFLAFVEQVVTAAAEAKPGSDLGQAPVPGGSGTLEEARQMLVGKLGENISVRRWQRLAAAAPGRVHSYVHMGGKIGVLLGASFGDAGAAQRSEVTELLDNLAMQVAAMAPLYLDEADVPQEAKAKQSEIFTAQLDEMPKPPPEKARAGIVQGKVSKWVKEICLLAQPSVIEAEKSVSQVVAETAKTLDSSVKITGFVRFEKGEGIERPQGEAFADEVAKMAKG